MTGQPPWSRSAAAGLIGVCAVALAIRWPGIDAHLPDIYWHDELNFIEGGLRVGAGEVVAASYGGYSHGTLTYYLLFAAFSACFLAGRLIGLFRSPDDLLMSYVTDPSGLVLVARLVLLAATTAAVGLTFVIARRLFGTRAALVSAGLLAVSFQSVQITLGKEDGLFALLVLATVGLALRLLDSPSSRSRLVALGAAAGVATAVKYFGVFLLPLIPLTLLLAGPGRVRISEVAAKTAMAGGAFVLIFLILVPGLLFDTGRFVSSFRALATVNTGTMFSDTGVAVSPWYGYLWNTLALSNGLVAAGLFYVAAAWLLRQRPRQAGVLLAYPATLFGVLTMTLVLGRPAEAVNFYQVSALPLLCIAGGAFLGSLLSRDWTRRLAGAAILVVIVAANVADDLRFERLLGLADTRTIARQWIEQHVEEEASMLVEGAIGTFVLEGPQLQETEGSLNRTLIDIRRLGGGGGLWSAKVRAARAGVGTRRFDVSKVRDVTMERLDAAPSYVVVRSERSRRLVESTGRYHVVFAATSDSPALFRSVPLLSSADIARLRRIPLLADDPQFTPGPNIHVYRRTGAAGEPVS